MSTWLEKVNQNYAAHADLCRRLAEAGLSREQPDKRLFDSQLGHVVVSGERFARAAALIADTRGPLRDLIGFWAGPRDADRYVAATKLLFELGFRDE